MIQRACFVLAVACLSFLGTALACGPSSSSGRSPGLTRGPRSPVQLQGSRAAYQFPVLVPIGIPVTQQAVLASGDNNNVEAIRAALKNADPRVRQVAIQTAGTADLALHKDLIALLEDRNPAINQAARQSLKQLSVAKKKEAGKKNGSLKAEDFGPYYQATAKERQKAAMKWTEWWAKSGD